MAQKQYAYLQRAIRAEADDALSRANQVLDVTPENHVAPRPGAIVTSWNRAGVAAAHAETLNASLQRVCELAYVRDTDARFCNLDALDGRVLFPVPWGRAGGPQWGLRRRESDILRQCLFQRMEPATGRPVPLFVYDAPRRVWYVNLTDYPTEADAMGYVMRNGVSSREYKRALAAIHDAKRATQG